MKRVAIITYGCKINQYESACILDDFKSANYEIVPFGNEADVYIINSCTVTNRTDYKSRNSLRKALSQKATNPNVKIIVTGCYSQRNADEISKLGAIDLIVDNNKKEQIFQFLQQGGNCFENILNATEFAELSTNSMNDKTRAFVKIQDGCDYYCAYCAIPFARGHSRSRKRENVLNQVEKLAQNDYQEFVFGGINLGLYRQENDYSLADLLFDVEKIEGVKIIRLSSIEPQLFTDNLLAYFRKSKKIAPHFHIPLQVGCDELLLKMNRKYITSEFSNQIDKIREIFPNVAIGIDVIVGLPGETDVLFQETLKFLQNLDFTYLHVFSYSKRFGTKAAEMKGQIGGKTMKKRSNILTELSDKKKQKYIKKILLQRPILSGIVESEKDGWQTVLSDHFIRIYLKNEEHKRHCRFRIIGKIFDGIEVEILR
ncbi:MAG: tRNA (N(6)-L-threonylcarbamoyladenosine(37)-C(2))-methylthiotransferase MtaB [Candidatus Cloacimonetes bacterium]|jgi:threonylcarbamoyladenosine tRNA methylthiotransferase MtaB|nr:tRNA (N(6)-L-threonylcarbamoyladenosine(37)-C(2))-methylthiotransferase MtaB [Candidatus Cloacimonadota bacterium]